MKYSIVGQKHCGAKPYNEGVLPGTPVVLVREPDNAVDKNAVQVWIGDKRIGYIAAKQNAELAALIDRIGRPWTQRRPISPFDARVDSVVEMRQAIDATFIRSPNSAYPMVEVNQ